MTFGTEQNRHLRRTFPACVSKRPPENTTVYIHDRMRCVKTKDKDIKTVQQYMQQHILKPVAKILDGQYTHLYQLLDQKTCQTKALFTYHKRGKHVKPMEVPSEENGGPFMIPSGGYLPQPWERVIANREMTRREVYPLFYTALIEMYTPPMGKCMIVDGAPDHPIAPADYVEGESLSVAYFSKTYDEDAAETDHRQMGSRGLEINEGHIFATPSRPKRLLTCRKQCPKESYTHGCAEADLSAFFYVNKHFSHRTAPHQPNCDILINSGDGDTLMIALLQCKDRIDPTTGRFVNVVWVMMRGNGESRKKTARLKKEAESKGETFVPDVIDGEDAYININVLYIEICKHPQLRHSSNPALTTVALYILSGTDFFGDFVGDDHSLFYGLGWEAFVWDTWCAHHERFKNMVMMFYAGETTFNQPELLRRVYIDEDALVMFFYQCYAAKYGNEIAINSGNPDASITPQMIEAHTGQLLTRTVRKPDEPDDKWQARLRKAKATRCPPKNILRRYARLLKGNLLYWINDYRPGGHDMFDPLEKYNGFPYYGFLLDPADPLGKRYILSPIISDPIPLPVNLASHTGLHKRRKPQISAGDASLQQQQQQQQKQSEKRAREKQVTLTKTGQLAPVSAVPVATATTTTTSDAKPILTQEERVRLYGPPQPKKPLKKKQKPEAAEKIEFHAAKAHRQKLQIQ